MLVTRPEGRAGDLVAGLLALGIGAVHVPAIEIRPAHDGGSLDAALADLEPAGRIVLTSASAARAVLGAAARVDLDPLTVRWAAVGEATAAVLHDAGIEDVFVPSEASGQALARQLPLHPGERVLVPRADIADGRLLDSLAERGAAVRDVVAYETAEAPESSRPRLAAALEDGPLDAVILTSGSTARGLLSLADGADRARLAATPAIAAGAPTAAAAREAGFDTVLVAPSPNTRDLVAFTARALGAREDASPFDLGLADETPRTGATA